MSEPRAEAAFLRALDEGSGAAGPAWLESLRAEARAAFRASGLPTLRHEDWRFTPLTKLDKLPLGSLAGGRVSLELPTPGDLPAGCVVTPLSRNLDLARGLLGSCGDPKRRPFEALNTALFGDGALITLAPGVRVERPIELVYRTEGAAHVRTIVSAGPGSHAVIAERHAGDAGGSLVNAVTELRVDREAQVSHVLLQQLPESSLGFFAVLTRQEAASRLALHSLALGASLARVEIESRLEGEGAELDLLGLYLGRGSQHIDHHTTIDHATPRTTSRELFKGILDGRAHGVFHGRIHVRPGAQKIDASQTNRALLLADGAVIDSKPQLEIYADDVKCSHGASIGQLDPDQLFYLRARGLGAHEARALLTFAFASEVLEKLPLAALRESLEGSLLGWLAPGGGR